MNKVLTALVFSFLLSGCASTDLSKLAIPTNQSIGKEHDKFNRIVKKELSPYQQKLLQQYQAQHPDSNLLVLEAIKYQEQENADKEAIYQEKQQQRYETKLAEYAARLERFKTKSKAIYLKTLQLNEAKMQALIASDITISNFRLEDYSISKIPYLSPNNPKVYRVFAQYAYDVDFDDNFGVRSADLEMSLNYELENIIEKKTARLSLSPIIPHLTHYITFSIQSAAKISQAELEKVIPLYRLDGLKNNLLQAYKLEYFDQYKEKLQFRLSKLNALYDEMQDPKRFRAMQGGGWDSYETFSPISASEHEQAFFDYLLQNSAF